MAAKYRNTRGLGQKRRITGGKFSFKEDDSQQWKTKKRQKKDDADENIESDESEGELGINSPDVKDGDDELDDLEEETVDEKRKRIAKEHLAKLSAALRREEEEEDEVREYEREGERDSSVAAMELKRQLEESGRLRRAIASMVQKPEVGEGFRIQVKHRHSVTAICLSRDDSKGYSASKDGTIMHWDVDNGKGEKYRWPSVDVLKAHGVRDPVGHATRHSKNVSALAVSTDGRYLASGGLDRHVHLWDTRTREHVQAFSGHRGAVSCLAFAPATCELFSGSFDRSIKIWNVEDRAYMQTLFGHQSEVLMIDCLRKEQALAVGRDRTMQLFKVNKDSRLIFRSSTSSLECCCFIDNNEFLSGSDDGSLELWNVKRKKPVFIAKHAHSSFTNPDCLKQDGGSIPGGFMACSWVSSVAVCSGTDLAASGAGGGSVLLWAITSLPSSIQHIHSLSLVGFVNSLAFARSGKFLVAGVGHEPRLGRWGLASAAQDGVAIQQLNYS